MREKEYLTTGELADMFGISKQNVIYYDRIGLLSPARRDAQEYRYYSMEQVDEMDVILTFRNLGVPIKEVKAYLTQKTPQNCIRILKEQQERVEKEAEHLARIRSKLEKRVSLLEEAAAFQDFEQVEFYTLQDEMYLAEYCKGPGTKQYMETYLSLCLRSTELEINFENPICNIISRENLESGNFLDTEGFAIRIPERCRGCQDLEQSSFWRRGGLYAVTYHKGTYESIGKSYERLLDVICGEGYQIVGDAFETDLLSTLTSMEPDDYLKLISVPVRKR